MRVPSGKPTKEITLSAYWQILLKWYINQWFLDMFKSCIIWLAERMRYTKIIKKNHCIFFVASWDV